jgi:hypothetical protein
MKPVRQILAALSCAAALHSNAGAFTDLWYNPQESGWGANVVQQLETAFVTLFVYGPDGAPTWYVASDARVVAYSPGALPIFSGTLYRMRGPWHGGAFDPREVDVTPVGTLSLETLSKDRMRIHYVAEGVNRVKEVVRQTWQPPLVGANYIGTFNLRQAPGSGGPAYGTMVFHGDTQISLDNGVAFIRADDQFARRCEYRGSYEQTGKLAKMSGQFTCTAGNDGVQGGSGTFEVSDFEVTDNGFSGYLRTASPAVHQFGRFGGVLF